VHDFRRLPQGKYELHFLGYYIVSTGNSLPLFQDSLSVASSGVKNLKRKNSQPLKMGPVDCPKTSVRNYHYLLH